MHYFYGDPSKISPARFSTLKPMQHPMSIPFATTLNSLACFLAIFAPTSAFTADPEPSPEIAPRFFVFENGLPGLSTDDRITLLKELGYHGIGSARPNNIPERLEKYDAAGLKILSLYVGGKLGEKGHTYDPAIADDHFAPIT